jgi:hypothetical protein
MGVNTGLLNETVREIKDGLFKWNQGSWADSDYVTDGLSPDEFRNACGTSYCFAGRVATRERDTLYTKHADYPRDKYSVTSFVIPMDMEDEDLTDGHTDHEFETHYRTVVRDGKIEFEEYNGLLLDMRSAATRDLGLDYLQASSLFEGSNTLDRIEGIIDRIVHPGQYDDEYCCYGCDGY